MLSGMGGVLVASLFLLIPTRVRTRLLPLLISFATGSLLATVFLDLLPELTHALPGHGGLGAVLGGILGLHILERLFLWRHCHEPNCGLHGSTVSFSLLGDGLHNFVDGLTLAAAFSVSWETGLAASVAILFHEIPQEIGDFAILLNAGMKPTRALRLNALVSLSSVAGTVLGLTALSTFNQLSPYALALAAASFLYIALGDLLPSHRAPASLPWFSGRLGAMVAGIALVVWVSAQHAH